MNGEELLIITACIIPVKECLSVAIRDVDARKEQYLNTIVWAIQKTSFHNILFIDNSGYDLGFIEEYISGYIQEKDLEIISFVGDSTNIALKGKGYGEGEMLSYALDHSRLVAVIRKNGGAFWKITGGLECLNIEKLRNVSTGNCSYFQYNFPYYDMVDTRLYKMNIETYEKYFRWSYENVDDNHWICLEHVYKKTLETNAISWKFYRRFPDISGMSRSTGKSYRLSKWKRYRNNILCIIGIYNNKYVFKLLNYSYYIKRIKEIIKA